VARLYWIILLVGLNASAEEENLFDKAYVEMSRLEVTADFDEKYRPLGLELERILDLRRAECSEISTQVTRQLCFREVVTLHKKYLELSFSLKIKYLKVLHVKQLSALEEAQKSALKELERQF
jgi:hypothetical protein